jgi:UDP-glucose 4-epimerase
MAGVVWVTGCRGFIGRHVARHLSTLDFQVHGIGHGAWTATDRGQWGVADWVNGDITAGNLAALAAVSGRPSVVVHLAGGSSVGSAIAQPHEDFARTVVATANLLEWVRLHSPESIIVAASSAAVYGSGHSGAIIEGAMLRPYSPYGYHKLMMEHLCRAYGATYGIRSLALRFFSVYGPELRKQLLWDVCERLRAGDQQLLLGGTGAEIRDWVYVTDAARAVAALMMTASAVVPTVNVGTGAGVAVEDLVARLSRAWAGAGSRPVSAHFSGQSRSGDPFSLVADGSALTGAGFRFETPLDMGIEHYTRWYRALS